MRYYFDGNTVKGMSTHLKLVQGTEPIKQIPFESQEQSLQWLKDFLVHDYHVKFYEPEFKITDKKGKPIVGEYKKNTKYKLTITRDEKIETQKTFFSLNEEEFEIEFEDGEAEIFFKFYEDENVLDVNEEGEYMMFAPMKKIKAY